jgi:hopanoid biosynthesis associated protein HpnK
MKRLIITGDDFGLSVPVNEAIEGAHRRGILSAASLMVGAKASADAVDRARRLPTLRVGLHIALVRGFSVLSPQEVPDLVDERGRFSSHLVRTGINYFFRPKVRRQLEAEIRAQFLAFQRTGLSLDHVNGHNHMHLHPTVMGLILKVGRDHGLRAVRYPYEPVLPSWRASRRGLGRKLMSWIFLSPWLALLKKRLRRAQVRSNHFIFGLNDSGNMNLELVLSFLRYLPPGVTEIYFHPASCPCSEVDRTMMNYRYQDEFAVLTSPALRQVLAASDIQSIAFSDL